MNALVRAALDPGRRISIPRVLTVCLSGATMALGCGSSGTSATSTTSSTGTPNAYTTVYKAMSFGSTVTVSYPSTCEMALKTSGKPDYTPNPYYLAPAGMGQTAVAYTAVTKTALAVISYTTVIAPSLEGSSATINICPTQASTTTATSLGAIGYLISGTAMFNPYEMNASTPAVADNASYTFTDGSGNQQTAYFLDQCNSHSNGNTWHAHGNPSCVTSQVDTSTGPSHIIGIALDGFPIYGGRDINGNIVNVSQLDACNGITSATPEFPSGAYHYVLPIGVTTQYASINCYRGTVSAGTMAAARKLACNMKTMFAMIESKQNKESAKQTVATMAMPDGSTMPAGSM
ncbi:MAG: YHYH protein [Acidobacteriaceae bacterium]